MGRRSELVTSDNSDDSGDAFTDGDFGDSDEDTTVVERAPAANGNLHETVNTTFNKSMAETNGISNGSYDKGNSYSRQSSFGSLKSGKSGSSNGFNSKDEYDSIRRDSHGDLNPSIVGIIGGQHSHAEQRLAARRAARAEAREIRMRELERQQREQENNADKAYDMYAGKTVPYGYLIRMRELERQQREQENNADKAYDMYAGKTETAVRRGGARLAALAPGLHSPRRSSEDSVDDSFSLKDLRHELKEVSEKFRAAMILNAQLDNDKAALRYQLEQLRDQAEEQREAAAQLQREHKEKCSAHERLKREHASLDRELLSARDAILARDAAAAAAGRAFVEATGDVAELAGSAVGSVPALALVSRESEEMLNDAGEGTLDVRLQKLVTSRQELEAEVRRLKLQLNDERAARVNGASGQDCESDLEVTRKSLAEAKARAARAEAEAALQGAAVARLEAQVARLRARQEGQDEHEHALKQERRRLQREAREALNRVEELETENNHLTKRLDKLKNAKSALLKEL